MLVRATITTKASTDVLVEVPDGEYTKKDLMRLAKNGELLDVGEVVEEYDSEDVESSEITIYEIDGKAV